MSSLIGLRELNALLAVAALALLLFRGIGTWPDLPRSSRVLTVLLASTLAVGAVGSWALSRATVVDTHLSTGVSYSLLVLRFIIIIVCVGWHRVMGTHRHPAPIR